LAEVPFAELETVCGCVPKVVEVTLPGGLEVEAWMMSSS
jgi:hypothetical protein